jgi:hypothetical protein
LSNHIKTNIMATHIDPKKPQEVPYPNPPEFLPPIEPDEAPVLPDDPEIIPPEDPFENPPPYEVPEPGEGP